MGRFHESVVSFQPVFIVASLTRPANATQYSDRDAISAADNSHFTFGQDFTGSGASTLNKGVTRPGQHTGTLLSAKLVSSANQSTKLDAELWLFQTDFTDIADNSEITFTDDELKRRLGTIRFPSGDWDAGNSASGGSGNAICEVREINLPIIDDGKGRIYGQLVAKNAYTPVSEEEFTVELVFSQD